MDQDSGFQVADDAALRYHEHVARFMSPLCDELVAAAVSPGDRVLDVACGTGFATRAAAQAVGSAGRVSGSDVNSGMIAVARAASESSGVGITWHEAPAEKLPFGDGEFDSVICQQGLQFFPDPSVGLGEMARVTRPGGRLAATVWTARSESPYLEVQGQVLADFCGCDPDELLSPFAQSGPGPLEGWFAAAGLDGVEVRSVEVTVSLPPVRDYLPDHMGAMPWAEAFAGLDPDRHSEALAFAEERLARFRTDRGIDVPFRSHLAIAYT